MSTESPAMKAVQELWRRGYLNDPSDSRAEEAAGIVEAEHAKDPTPRRHSPMSDAAFLEHTKAVGEFLSEMAEIHSLDALEPPPSNVQQVTEALLRVSREIRERMDSYPENLKEAEARGVERAASLIESAQWLATPEAPGLAKKFKLEVAAVRALSPDPDYTARIRREALEEAATIAVGHQLKGHNGEKCGQPGQLVCGIAIASEIQALIKK